ncbi:MAG TPA: SDR family oxidoreductase [Candidatus Nitrosocosmicus sp.]|nr:SDR family oxidoreductase [Candidatus Nitrosocosmicus sp.]
MTSIQKVAVVTGSSNGIGLEIALKLARNAFMTYATMRNLAKSKELETRIGDDIQLRSLIKFIQLDVTDDNSVKKAIVAVVNESERIDVLVNNAGYGLSGALEDISLQEFKDQFETNVFGLIRTTQEVIPIMRKQNSGIIVNISSGLGRFGIGTSSAYVSSKFAVEGLSESISYELEPFGIRTILVEPGVIKTNFINSSVIAKRSLDRNSPYIHLIERMKNGMSKLIENAAEPELVANVVIDAIKDKNPKLRYLAGKDVEQILGIKNKVSDEEFHDMLKQMATI